MNTTKIITAFSCNILACLLLANQPAYAGIAGHAQFVIGNVQIVNPEMKRRALRKGDAVNEGDIVLTTKGSNAQIKMQDGGFVAVRPETQLKFDSFKFSGKEDGSEKLIFSLLKGGFRSVTGLIGRINKPSYRINTAAATIGIRGTDHETLVVTPDSPLAQTAPAGTYNKVNVGETYIATEKGTIFVLPNQMGYAGAADQMPELRPLSTDLFTVASKPTKEAKSEKDEGEEVRETAAVDNTAVEAAPPEEETILAIAKESPADILQPIETTAGENLSGEITTPVNVGPVAAYVQKNILIEIATLYGGTMNYMAAPTDMTFSGGGLSSFIDRGIVGNWSQSFSVIGGTSPVPGTVTSGTGIQFGRWTSATAVENTYTNPLGGANSGASSGWMYGTQGYLDTGYASIGGPMYGVFNYVLDGNNAPFDNMSQQSGVLNSATLTVDFTTNLVDTSLALTMGGTAWTADAIGMLLSGNQFSGTPTITTAGVACGTCSGSLNGAFTGLNYAGAILSYNLNNYLTTTQTIQGQAAFLRDPLTPITSNATGVWSGIYMLADPYGGIQQADTLTTNTSGVLTGYSWGSPAIPQGGYWSTSVSCISCTAAFPAANSAGINYGTWDAGSITQTYGSSLGSSSPLWITGPESGPLYLANALVGTKTFSYDGGMVVNANGVTGTVLGTTTLTADFTRQLIGVNIDLSVPDTSTGALHNWNANTTGNESNINGGSGIGGATFYASSFNQPGAGGGMLTVTVDGVTLGNGTVLGQLTGIGFNGAILSYNLDAMIGAVSPIYEQVNGVAALVGATSNVATPHRGVMFSMSGASGFYQNNPTRVLTDTLGNLTQFDAICLTCNNGGNGSNSTSATLLSGTSVLANAGSDPLTGISWGRWDGGNIDFTDRATGITGPSALSGSLHWIAGPTETTAVTLPVSGTYTYTNAGGTLPTDDLGNVGSLNNATLSADFTAQTVNIGVNATVAGATLDAAASNVPIIQNAAFYASSMEPVNSSVHLAVTCTGTCGTATQGDILGHFSGAGATGAMMTYGLQNISAASTQTVSGVAAFRR